MSSAHVPSGHWKDAADQVSKNRLVDAAWEALASSGVEDWFSNFKKNNHIIMYTEVAQGGGDYRWPVAMYIYICIVFFALH